MIVDPSIRFPSKENHHHGTENSKALAQEPFMNLQISPKESIPINQLKESVLETLKSEDKSNVY